MFGDGQTSAPRIASAAQPRPSSSLNRDGGSARDALGGEFSSGQQVVARDARPTVDEPIEAGPGPADVPSQDVAVLDERLAREEQLGFGAVDLDAKVSDCLPDHPR